MAKPEYPYPEDEFDSLGSDRIPQGVHRTPTPRWRTVLPFVVALILAPALAYLGVSALSGSGTPEPAATSVTSALPTAEPTGEETPEPQETAEATPTPEPTPTGDVQRAAQVFILNGTPTEGLGATAVAALTADGFTDLTADDYGNRLPTVSTVYYNNAALADTALRIADLLGVGQLLELPDATDSIAVVLRSDYVPPASATP